MKKMFIGAALVMGALVMTSCNGEGCYKVKISYADFESESYVYGNSEDVDVVIEKAKQLAALIDANDFKATRTKQMGVNKDDCLELNKK